MLDTSIHETLSTYLTKGGGAGSRGGTVIGHTSTGRPIYAKHSSGNSSYSGFSASDHFEAAREHLGRVGKLNHKARNNPQKQPTSLAERAMSAQAGKHMQHYLGHIRRAKAMNRQLPANQRLEALA